MTHSKYFRRAQFGLATDGKKDCHHLLWCRHDWDNGYANKLRSHPYFEIKIPQDSLHRQIHQSIPKIPVPSGGACHRALDILNSALEKRVINVSQDTPQARLEFLIDIWQDDPSARGTIAALTEQLEIFAAYERKIGTRLVAIPPTPSPLLVAYRPAPGTL